MNETDSLKPLLGHKSRVLTIVLKTEKYFIGRKYRVIIPIVLGDIASMLKSLKNQGFLAPKGA